MIQREDTQLKAPTDFHQLKQLKETLKVKNKTRSIDQVCINLFGHILSLFLTVRLMAWILKITKR